MSKIRLGLITVSLPPELSTMPAEAVQLPDRLSARAKKVFEKNGCEVIRITEQAQTEEASVKATRELVNKKVDCIIYLVGSWIYVPIVITATKDLKVPFILWSVPELQTCSLVASSITHGSLDEMGIKHKFVYALPEDPDFITEVTRFARAAMAVRRMDGMRFGLFGGRCMYMYTGMPDLIQMKRIFGVETVHIDEFMLVFRAQKISNAMARNFLGKLKKEYGKIEPSENVMLKSIKLYLALKEVIKEEKLDFVGLKCMPEVQGNYTSHCLSVSLTINDGIIAACEADTNAALSMQILHLLSGRAVGFGDLFEIGMKDKRVRLVNCGSVATEFAVSKKDVDWGLQYDFIAPGPGRGATTVFVCKPGRVTLARLARIKGEYVMHIASGEAYSQPKKKMKEARDHWPHIFFTLDGDPKEFLQNCRSNHHHWVYGDFREELVHVCDLLGIRAIVT